MRIGRAVPRWSLLTLIALAACQDGPGTAPVLDAPPEPVLRPPPLPSNAPLSVEGYRTPGERRIGWIFGRGGEPREVQYEVQGEWAIWEGDIVIGRAEEIARTLDELRARPSRGVVIDGDGFRWPGGVVPYEIAGDLPNQGRVTGAIAIVEEQTAGVNLVPRNGEANFIRFVTSDGCSSAIGMQGGQQNINLADDCSTGNAAHEILHALGMFHEHTRCDRDDFVVINFDNIEEGKEGNFDIACDGASDIGEYAEGSMMHYGAFAFSANDLPTIESLRGLDHLMGQRDGLGPTDTETINLLYGANNVAPTAVIAALAPSYPEGSPVPFDGSGSTDPDDATLLYSWSFGDGTCSVATPPAKCSQVSPSHTYADDGAYTVELTVSDGFASDDASTTATIVNVAPVVSAGDDATEDEGSLFSQSGSFTDPGADSWTATVDYGDGGGAVALALTGKTFELSHTYVDNGVYTVTVEVTDDEGDSGSDQVEVTVLNVPPTVDAGPDAEVTSGETFELSGSFSDPGIDDDPWTWEIDWGFGANTTGSTNDQSALIEASRQVCVAGTYTVTLSVTDKDGGTGMDDLTLTVPYFEIDIDISPTEHPNPVSLKNKGLLPVAILSTADFDATEVDPATLVLGNEVAGDTPVAFRNNGTAYTVEEDVNGDGLTDLVAMFRVPALVANGDLWEATTELVLRAFLDDGCTNVRGVDQVTVNP